MAEEGGGEQSTTAGTAAAGPVGLGIDISNKDGKQQEARQNHPLAYTVVHPTVYKPPPSIATADETSKDERVPVKSPYRKKSNRAARPDASVTKGILKPAPAPQPRFSFRRDVLSYMGESLAPLAGGGGQPTASTSQPGTSGLRHPEDTQHGETDHRGTSPGSTVSLATPPTQAAPAKGTFWRRLGGAVTAAAAAVPVSQAVRTIGGTVQPLRQGSHPPAGSPGVSSSPNTHPFHSNTNGNDAASTSSSTSHNASQNVGNHQSPSNAPNPLSVEAVKSVRFTMSSLTVVYPINAPNPPGTEANTRRRINQEYSARKKERTGKGWTGQELTRLYDECCRTREEPGIPELRRLLGVSSITIPLLVLKL